MSYTDETEADYAAETYAEMRSRHAAAHEAEIRSPEHESAVAEQRLLSSDARSYHWEALLDAPAWRETLTPCPDCKPRNADRLAELHARDIRDGRPPLIVECDTCGGSGNIGRQSHWGRDGAMIGECNPIGDAIPGSYRIASFSTPEDPIWRPNGEPRWRYIGELAPSHRKALYGWLMRRATYIAAHHVNTWYASPFGMDDGAEHFAEQAERQLGQDPWSWLAERPFMRALAALLIGDGNAGIVESWDRRGSLGPPPAKNGVELIELHVASIRLAPMVEQMEREKTAKVAGLRQLSALGVDPLA